jgi:hypothetical protein
MAWQDITANIMRGRARPFVNFRIDASHVVRSKISEAPAFKPKETYIEVRLTQIHLRNRRELWQRQIASASLLIELLFDGEWRTIPFVVGRDLLKRALPENGDASVEQLNIQVAGPYPYVGGEVRVFAGLFRVETENYLQPALELLESVAKAFDVTKLSSYLSVADPLLKGVEAVLGLRPQAFRVGVQRSYERPRPGDAGEGLAEVLEPGYEVVLGLDAGSFDPADKQRFWVIDGRLHFGETSESARRYLDADFIMFRLAALPERPDLDTLDFHRVHWERVAGFIWAGEDQAAERAFNALLENLGGCKDLVYGERNALLQTYPQLFRDEKQKRDDARRRVRGPRFEAGHRRLPVTREQLASAAQRGRASGNLGPEDPDQALAQVRL